MLCSNCGQTIDAHGLAFAVCPNCGATNIVNQNLPAPQTSPQTLFAGQAPELPKGSKLPRIKLSAKLLAVLAIGLVVLSSATFAIVHQSTKNNRLKQAKTNAIASKVPTVSGTQNKATTPPASQPSASNTSANKTTGSPIQNASGSIGSTQPAAKPNKPSICYQIAAPANRNTADQPDDNSGYQLHIIYALPSDGSDNQYDTNGAIAMSVSAWENWLCGQTGGKTLRLDTYKGTLDVSFVRFSSSDNTIKTGSDLPWSTNPDKNPYVREDIEIYLKSLGFNDPHKLYAVYYDGTSNYSCGGGAWPPTIPGHVAAEYMHGGDPNYPPCQTNHLASNISNPGYFDFDILHESMHTLGFVASCAPHHVLSGHASDSNTDLMYSGSQPWYPSVLDINHDDYYATGNSNCLDLANSAFLTGGSSQLPPSW